jgi:DNA-binding IclR family transcriptional regulator
MRNIDRDTIIKAITAQPGLRCQDLAATFDCPAKPLSALLRGLVTAGALLYFGSTRGRRYYPPGYDMSKAESFYRENVTPSRPAKPQA